jgi:MFS family permease
VPPRPWAAVAVLTLVTLFNTVDRLLPTILAEPIKRDLALSDTALGLINGLGFLLVYAVMSIPIARLSDRGRYGLAISACLAAWSAMTALGGLARSGVQLGLTRMGVAVGEAGSIPAAHAFISRHFPPGRRATPLAVLTLSAPLGGVAAALGGGLLGQAIGWRNTLVAMGTCGLALAPVVLLALGLRPAARTNGDRHAASFVSALGLFRKRSFLLLLAGGGSVGVGAYSMVAFSPAFLMRVHGMTLREVGIDYGLTQGVSGVAGLMLLAALADRLSRRDPRWPLWLNALSMAMIAPLAAAAFVVPGRWAAIICLAMSSVGVTAYVAPAIAALHRLAPVQQRATASAILLLMGSVFGGVGPLVTGLISDALAPRLGVFSLARGLLLTAPVALAAAAVFFALATLSYPEDMDEGAGGPLDDPAIPG